MLHSWLVRFFGCPGRVLHIREGAFLLFRGDREETYSLERGEAGQVYQLGHNRLVLPSPQHDPQLDLQSLHPVYYVLLHTASHSLVLQIPLRHCRSRLSESQRS